MGRQLFLHHYFPALYFAILLSCAVFDLGTSTLRPKVRLQIAAILILLVIWHFTHFSSLAYGGKWTKNQCQSAKWLKTWDFSCNDFYDEYSQYNQVGSTPHQSQFPVAHTVVGDENGRAGVVVPHDNKAAMPDLAQGPGANDAVYVDSETTGIRVEGVPEPGRNVFDANGGEVKSKSDMDHLPPPADALPTTTEKEISAVVGGGGGGGGVAGQVVGGTSAEVRKEEPEKAKQQTEATTTEPVKDTTTNTSKAPEDDATTSAVENTNTKKEKPVVAGPLDENQQEAKKAAEELFGEMRR